MMTAQQAKKASEESNVRILKEDTEKWIKLISYKIKETIGNGGFSFNICTNIQGGLRDSRDAAKKAIKHFTALGFDTEEDEDNNTIYISWEKESSPRAVPIGIDAGQTTTSTYVCRNEKCPNGYLIFLNDEDKKICEQCGKSVDRLSEKDLKPRPGELEALREKWEMAGGEK